ncbi:hypothetical protein K3495_g2786 [Podosphaera aphanis]|nr:hypothetical protein K3495_g2786 [Podosphaera aphanis]
MARCMLKHAKLPLRFWDAAILTACYMRNRLPILPESKTPFEAMHSTKPNLSNLKVWGCICYALLDTTDPKRYKLSPTSYRGIFIGYCESPSQYRIYVPSKAGNKLIVSANVKFLEDTFWDWEKSSSEQFDTLDIEQDNSDELLDIPFTYSDSESDDQTPNLHRLHTFPSPTPTNLPPSNLTPFSSSPSSPSSSSSADSPQSQDAPNSQISEPAEDYTIPGSFGSTPLPQVLEPRRSTRERKQAAPRSALQLTSHSLYLGGNVQIPKT